VIRSLDMEHRTMRQQLFTAKASYARFADDYSRGLLQGNSLAGWLASLWRPGRSD
jgi:hypothetical protein